jgi:hypothetical protein
MAKNKSCGSAEALEGLGLVPVFGGSTGWRGGVKTGVGVGFGAKLSGMSMHVLKGSEEPSLLPKMSE